MAVELLEEEFRETIGGKFFRQYRRFFRYYAASRILVLAWLKGEDTRRARESANAL